MKEITAYKCDFCEKWLRSKAGMSRHEKKCFWNPDQKACASCGHNEEYEQEIDYIDYEQDTGAGIVRQSVAKSRWCNQFGFDLFAERKNLRKDCHMWSER